MDPAELALKAAWGTAAAFASTLLGLLLARRLYDRLEALARPISRLVGMPASLVALSAVDPRTPHVLLAQAMRQGILDFRHVLAFSLATWPLRSFMLHLRLGIVPLALSSLGPLGAAYLAAVYLPPLAGLALAIRRRPARWPEGLAAAGRAAVSPLRAALSVTARYAVFEALFAAVEALGLRPRLELPLSPEAVAIASAAAVRPSLGIAAAGPAYRLGRVAASEVLAALLLGRLVYLAAYELPRGAVQLYASIYPPGVASRLALCTAAVIYGVSLPLVLLVLALKF